MAKKKKRVDFVKFLQSQLEAFQARRFAELDVEVLGGELETVVGCYRSEVRRSAARLIPILMRRYDVYGDWDDLRLHWEMLLEAIKDSPSLTKRAAAEIKAAYTGARLKAELRGVHGWPKRCPWRTLEELGAAVKARNREYRELEQAGNKDFGNCRRVPLRGNQSPQEERTARS